MNTHSSWQGLLVDGEDIIWQGKPLGGVVWRDLIAVQTFMGIFSCVFSVIWLAAALSMTGSMPAHGPDAILLLFGLVGCIFFGLGLYMMIGRIFRDAYTRGRTTYTPTNKGALTNKGAFIAREIFGKRSLKRYSCEAMTTLDLRDDTAGSAMFAEDLRTCRQRSPSRIGLSRGLPRRTRTTTRRIPMGFRRIMDARAVYRLIRLHRVTAAQSSE